ncbi:MAG: acyl carrier protein [Clostridia bacterium]|nr:acyl carrier protein [Clostridia bacterium]MBR0159224.1 acyl carrier protein [Clostridia bacterium]MBR7063127.1 acyl carrier protein [Clostridia bacterium]
MFEKVKDMLIKQLRLKNVEITPESRIKEDLGADSLDVLQMLMTLEEDYGITIPDEKLAEFKTVADIVNYCDKHVK